MNTRNASHIVLPLSILFLLTSSSALLPVGPARLAASTERVEAEADEDVAGRDQWFISQRAYPFAAIPPDARRDAWASSAALRREAQRVTALAFEPKWRFIGPQPSADVSPATFLWTTSGRVTSIAVSPANSLIVLVGGAAGGIWRSTDGGAHFAPTTDNQIDAAVGSIAFAPSNPLIVYAGMGEPYGYLGSGVLKSTDAGQTWARVNNSTLASPCLTAKIAVDPTNPNRVYVAQSGQQLSNGFLTGSGFYYSTDGGVNWTKTISGTPRDIAISPANPQTIYVGMLYVYDCCNQPAGIYKSTNGGQTWTRVFTTPFDNNTADNLELAVSPASPQSVYAFTGGTIAGASDIRVIVSNDNGQTWINKGATGIHAVQFWYNCYIAVDPINANTLYAATTMLYKSTDGGNSWNNLTNGYAPGPYQAHVDQHAFAFSPANANEFYIGNDGGAWKTSDGGVSLRSINDTLSLTQFYSVALHPTNPLITYAGSQDNSLQGRGGTSLKWDTLPSLGEGKDIVIDAVDPSIVYYSDIRCLVIRNKDNGRDRDQQIGSSQIFGEPDSAPRVNWTAPLAGNGRDSTLYFGTWRLFKSTDRGNVWTKPAGDADLTKGVSQQFGPDTLSAISVAHADPNVIYTGSAQGRAMVSTNGGASFADVTHGLPDRYINQITVDSTNPASAYLIVSGYRTGHVFKTTNYGATWTDVSGNLPDTPANALLIDPLDPNVLLVGTDIGVFRSLASGHIWAAFNDGLPPAVVTGLSSQSTGLIQLSTYGRGVYELVRDGVTIPKPQISSVVFDAPKKLTISGSQFGSAPRVLIDDVERTDFVIGATDVSIQLKGKAKKLGLKSGDNTIQVLDSSGASSNTFVLKL